MLSRVFAPIRIGALEIPNRIVRTAHATGFSREAINDDLIAYHLARARGGVGMTVVEAGSVHPSSSFALSVRDDAVIPAYRRLVDAIAPTGMRLIQQLWHGGHTDPAADGGPPWGVSSIAGRYAKAPPVEMSTDQIGELVQAYAHAAVRMREAGLDGVEVLAGNGYLFSQFLSPVLNQRTDRYGGALSNRMRALMETLRAIRAATGPDFVVGLRIGDSSDPRLLDADDANAAARAAQDERLVDYVSLTHGDYAFHVDRYAAMDQPVGYQLEHVTRLARGITLPRIIVGRYATLDDAEQALRRGDADLVGIVRGTIADPDLVAKTKAGHATRVRPCIGCNQGCIGGVFTGRMACVVNPTVGFESMGSEQDLQPSKQPVRVLVIGGGVAGMEAARVARLRAHHVILAEATPQLGGLLNVARRMPKSHALGDIGVWLEGEIYRLGVEVRLSTYVEAADALALSPEAVIVATGSQPADPRELRQTADPALTPLIALDMRVVDSIELIQRPEQPWGRRAVVFDDVGHYEAVGCCEQLTDAGLEVVYVTRHAAFAPAMETTGRNDSALRRLYGSGRFRLVTQSVLTAARDGFIDIRPIFGRSAERIPADLLVVVAHRRASNALYGALRGKVAHLHLVGDALSPRDLQPAIREGHRAARALP